MSRKLFSSGLQITGNPFENLETRSDRGIPIQTAVHRIVHNFIWIPELSLNQIAPFPLHLFEKHSFLGTLVHQFAEPNNRQATATAAITRRIGACEHVGQAQSYVKNNSKTGKYQIDNRGPHFSCPNCVRGNLRSGGKSDWVIGTEFLEIPWNYRN